MKSVAMLLIVPVFLSVCAIRSAGGSPLKEQALVRFVRLECPSEASLGEEMIISPYFRVSQPLSGNHKMFVQFFKSGKLYFLADYELQLPTSRWVPKKIMRGGPVKIEIPTDIPLGEYSIQLGVYTQNYSNSDMNDFVVGRVQIADRHGKQQKRMRKPKSSGTYWDRHGVPHRWYITDTHALVWDGNPWFPVGGMYCAHFQGRYKEGDIEHNKKEWKVDVEALDKIKAKGITDLYINSDVISFSVPEWQPLIDYLDENGFCYGIQMTPPPRYRFALDGYYVIRNHDGTAPFVLNEVKESGKYSLVIPVKSFNLGTTEVLSVLYLLFDQTDSRAVEAGEAKFSQVIDGGISVSAEVKIPKEGHDYSLYFVPRIHPNNRYVGCPDVWGKYAEVKKAQIAALKKLKFGRGLRFFLDPFINEQAIANEEESFFFYHTPFQAQYASWLRDKYGDLSVLRREWALKKGEVSSFQSAASLVPVQAGPEGSRWQNDCYLVNPADHKVYVVDYARSMVWYDYLDFRNNSFRDYNNRIADAIKEVADVPVVFKHVSINRPYFVNDREKGGFDGLGYEIYSQGEGLVGYGGGTYPDLESSKKTMWSIVTEHTYDWKGLDYNKNNNFPSLPVLFSELDVMTSVMGARGYFSHGLRLEPYNRMLGAQYVDDPKIMEWMKLYKELLSKHKNEILKIKPKNYYGYPAGYNFWFKPSEISAFYRKWYIGAKTAKTPGGIWLFPTFSLAMDTNLFVVNLDNSPASLRFGPAFEEARRERKDCLFVYIGFRRDLGQLSIDRYFTDRFVTNEYGDLVQVLKPAESSKVLYQTKGGEVWGIIDGNLEIISNENVLERFKGNVPEKGDFMRNILLERTFLKYVRFGEREKKINILRDIIGIEFIDLGSYQGCSFREDGASVSYLYSTRGNETIQLDVPAGKKVRVIYADGTVEKAVDGKLKIRFVSHPEETKIIPERTVVSELVKVVGPTPAELTVALIRLEKAQPVREKGKLSFLLDGFEESPVQWRHSGGDPVTLSQTREPQFVKEGAMALKINYRLGQAGKSRIERAVAVKSGKNPVLSFWLYKEVQTDEPAVIRILLVEADGDRWEMPEEKKLFLRDFHPASWREVEIPIGQKKEDRPCILFSGAEGDGKPQFETVNKMIMQFESGDLFIYIDLISLRFDEHE